VKAASSAHPTHASVKSPHLTCDVTWWPSLRPCRAPTAFPAVCCAVLSDLLDAQQVVPELLQLIAHVSTMRVIMHRSGL
jgi:hypothetical protein